MIKKNNIIAFAVLSCLFLSVGLFAQSSVGGNLMIAENGSMTLYTNHDFAAGSGFVTPGMVRTSRTGAKGYLLFEKGSSWTGASTGRFVDGYVKVKHDQPFIFPIGQNNQFRPIAITGALNTSAAYFAKSPKISLEKSGTNGIGRISTREFWEVTGEESTELSFLWGKESNIANITKGDLEDLTIVGWKNGQWELIPSTLDKTNSRGLVTAVHKATSEFAAGVISTTEAIVPNDYEYFTLAAKADNKVIPAFVKQDVVSVFPNPVVKGFNVNIDKFKGQEGSITVYDIDGKEMTTRQVTSDSESTQQFDASNYENGMYKMYIKIGQQVHTSKFVVGRLY